MIFRVTIVVFVTAQLFLLISCDHEDGDSYPELEFTKIDRSNYVDPHDMLNYDRQKIKATSSKEKIGLKTHRDESTALRKPPDPNLYTLDETEVSVEVLSSDKTIQLNPEVQEAINCSSCSKNTTLIELPFLGRFVRTLIATLKIKDRHIEDNDILYISLLAVVNKRTQFILNEITKEGEDIQLKNLADLDEILTNLLILNEEKQDSYDFWSVTSIFSTDLPFHPKDFIVAMFICSLWFVLWLTFKGYSYAYILSRSFLPFFIVSWFWHWHYLHQMASAKRHSDLSKNIDVPIACRPDQLTTWGSIGLYFSTFLRNPDPCEEYYRVLMTDPSYEINPFVALIDMLAVGVFQPLRYIGTQVGSFFDGVLTSTGWMYKIPVLAAVLLVIFMILLMCFSYEIRIPFIKFGPSASLPQPPQQPVVQQSIAQQPIAGPQTVQGVSQDGSLAHNLLVDHPALNVPATQQYVYQKVTIERTFSHVQPVEVRSPNLVEKSPEEQSTIPLRAIEELTGSALSILTANDTNTEKIVQAVEQVSADSAEGSEKKRQLDDSMTSTEEPCKGIEL